MLPVCSSTTVGGNGNVLSIAQGPTCQQNLYTATVTEGTSVGTFVLRVGATSPTGSSIVWSIPDNSLGRFTINPTTGDVSVAQTLSRRWRAALEFQVRGTDTQTGLVSQDVSKMVFFSILRFFAERNESPQKQQKMHNNHCFVELFLFGRYVVE